MSKLSNKDLHTPFNNKSLLKLKGFILRGVAQQFTAATLAAQPLDRLAPVPQDADILSAYFLSSTAAAAGESMDIDLQVNGVSILTAPYTFDSTQPAGVQIELPIDPLKKHLATGQRVTVDRTYVAGGGPTMIATSVVVEPA